MRILPAALAGPSLGLQRPLAVSAAAPAAAPLAEDPLRTSWGYGRNENTFNELIRQAAQGYWDDPTHPLPPLLYKALIAVESSFDPEARSPSGAVGLAQIMPGTATRFGLKLQPVDERKIPARALPVGVMVLAEKHRVITHPGEYVAGEPEATEPRAVVRREGRCLVGDPPETRDSGLPVTGEGPRRQEGRELERSGQPPESLAAGASPSASSPWGRRVAEAYRELGPPTGDDLWHLDLAAYNGGGGTVLRAMAAAYDRGLDPRRWDNLIGPVDRPTDSPLYGAVREVFGERRALAKYREMARYPRRILALRDRGTAP